MRKQKDYEVICDESNNSKEDIAANRMNATIHLYKTRICFVNIELVEGLLAKEVEKNN